MRRILFIICLILTACSREVIPDKRATDLKVNQEKQRVAFKSKAAFLYENQIVFALLARKYGLSSAITEGLAWDFHKKHEQYLDMGPINQKYSDAFNAGKLEQYFELQIKESNISATIHDLSVNYSVSEETVAALIWDYRTVGALSRSEVDPVR